MHKTNNVCNLLNTLNNGTLNNDNAYNDNDTFNNINNAIFHVLNNKFKFHNLNPIPHNFNNGFNKINTTAVTNYSKNNNNITS